MPHFESSSNQIDESEISEQTPLLSEPRKPLNGTSGPVSEPAKAELRIILPALMVCAFLAAFDVTVVAAIYPIMYVPNCSC